MATKAEAMQAILDRITKGAKADIDYATNESTQSLAQAYVLLNEQP